MEKADNKNGPYYIILNPIAGKGHALKSIPEIETCLQRLGVDFRIVKTEYPGHGILLAEAACDTDTRGVIAAGGDGTGNEVINGLMVAKKAGKSIPPFGCLPVGRGNDLAYGAGMPQDLEAGCALLAEPRYKPMDVGLVTGGDYPEGRYFGNGIGIGFDTIVGLEAAKMSHVHGFLAYVFGAVKTLIAYTTPPRLELLFDGKRMDNRSPQLSVMNGTRMGGTFFMAPEAKNDDGVFDLCMTNAVSRGKLLSIIFKYTKGTQSESPEVWFGKTAELTIKTLEGFLVVHADGETICIEGKELKVECLKHQIMAVCGEGHVPTEIP